ncbi:hypothetical protein RFI_26263, partial [Reticulomyxa filosa]
NDHLEHSCCLQMVKCWFESFGCNHKCLKSTIHDHLTSNIKSHFDLVIKSFNTLQQTIRQYQDEIRKLKLENETLKVELQLKGKKDEEIAHLKQQLNQYQKDNLQLNSAQQIMTIAIIIKQKTTFVEIEKLKKNIESKDNEIKKIKGEIQLKQKQKIQQIDEHKEERKPNIIDTSSTLDFQLVRSFKLNKTFTGHTSYVWIRLWDIDNNKQIQSFYGHSSEAFCVKFSSYHYHNHHQNVICFSSSDKTIRFWDFKNNKQLQIFNGHTGYVYGIEFSPFNGGRYLCSGSTDKTIRLWD